MKKIIILTDSTGNPRFFNLKEKIELQETFPYLIKNKFKNALIWQLSLGNYLTDTLLNQTIAYFSEWNPDIIIISSGVNDSRPEPLNEKNKQKLLNSRFLSILFKSIIYSPFFIKLFSLKKTKIKRFEKSIFKFVNIFKSSKIFWILIRTHSSYDRSRPGTSKNNIEFNKVLSKYFRNNVIDTSNFCIDDEYFMKDGLHISKKGHNLIYQNIINKLNEK